MQVSDIMSTPVITCSSDDNMNTAAQRMWEHDCGAIPILDGNGQLTGIVTDRDICMAAYTQGKTLADIPVSSAMARQVVFCGPGDPIETAERIMREGKVRRIPVVDSDHRPLGLLSLNDVVRAAAAQRRGNGMQRELVETLSDICSPRPAAVAR